MTHRVLYIALLTLTLTGCTKKALSPEEFARWVNDKQNICTNEKVIGDYVFSAQYRPVEYLALQELMPDSLTKQAFDQRVSTLGHDNLNFLFRISTKDQEDILKKNISSESDYYARIQHFSSGAQNDFQLATGKDTIPCVLFHYQRDYNISPYTVFLLSFQYKPGSRPEGVSLIYQDQILGTGPVVLAFPKDIFTSIPPIQL